MGIHRGPNPVNDGLTFGCDTGYGIANNDTATRFYPGGPTVNYVTDASLLQNGWGGSYSLIDSATKSFQFNVSSFNGSAGSGQGWRSFMWDMRSHAGSAVTISATIEVPSDSPGNFAWVMMGQANSRADGTTTATYLGYSASSERVQKTTTTKERITWSGTIGNTGTANQPNGIIGFTVWYNGGTNGTNHFIKVSNVQIEKVAHETPFVNGTRSSTASLIDLKRTTNIDVSNVSFDSNGQPTFDNTDDRITMPNSSVFNHTSELSIEAWVKFDGNSEDFIFEKGNVNTQYSLFSHGSDIVFRTIHAGDSGYQTLSPSKTTAGITNGVWHHIVGSWDGSTKRIYVDGVDKASVSKSGALTTTSNGAAIGSFGGTSSGYYFGGDIAVVKIYDKGLSAAEVLQNYNAYKNRFNI